MSTKNVEEPVEITNNLAKPAEGEQAAAQGDGAESHEDEGELQTEEEQDESAESEEDGEEGSEEEESEDEESEDEGDEGEEDEAGEAVQGKKAKGGINKRMAELTKARRQAEREARETKARLDQALEVIDKMAKPGETKDPAAEKKAVVDEDPMPQPPEFNDPATFTQDMAAYTQKLAQWSARQAIRADRAEREAQTMQANNQRVIQQMHTEYYERRERALETYPDYEEIAENPTLSITATMSAGIQMDPDGPAIAYHLGKNPAEAARIAKLPPGTQLMELGAIKALLKQKAKAPARKRPPNPIRPVGAGSGGAPKGLDELSMEEYAARRNEDLRAGGH